MWNKVSPSGTCLLAASRSPVATFDLVVKNAKVVWPDSDGVADLDLGVIDGKFAELATRLAPDATTVFDAGGKLVFPGAVDAHQHWGIYNPLREDAGTESRACAQ